MSIEKDRADLCRIRAEQTKSNAERIAWLAAGAAWDTLLQPKPKLTARGRQLATLYSISRQIAVVPSAESAPDAPTSSPPEPAPEPIKPQPTGAAAPLQYASIEF